jgi:hypothetical protein
MILYYICDYQVVLCGCESWSLTLRKEYRLNVFENTVLRRISGPNRDKEMGECRRLHNEELYARYTPPNIFWVFKSKRIRDRACSTYDRDESCIQDFSGKT